MHLCLAGALQRREVLARAGAKSVLLSFAELKDRSMDRRVALVAEMREMFPFIFVDSGAHSFFSEAGDVRGKQRQTSMGSPEDWFVDYLDTIRECHQYADAFAELDVDSLTGMEPVLAWRERMSAVTEKVVPVFHSSWVKHYGGVRQTWEAWEEVCKTFSYVATEGSYGGQFAKGVQGQRRILEKARKHGARLHGFACTSVDLLKQVYYFSADSTSWLSGSMYGVSYSIQSNGDMRAATFENAAYRRKGREAILKGMTRRGIELPAGVGEAYLADDNDAVDVVNAMVWVEWEEVLSRKAVSRRANYWENPDALVIVEEEPCTCGLPDTEGACKKHGLGRHGVSPPRAVVLPEERKARIAQSMLGNTNALSTGERSARMPQSMCRDCYIGDRCPAYSEDEDAACALDAEFRVLGELLGTRSASALIEFLYQKLELDAARYTRGVFMEAADGGLPWKQVDGLSARLSSDAALLARLHGRLKPASLVDARSVNLVINTLGDEQYTSALEALAQLRAIAPQLLEAPEEDG